LESIDRLNSPKTQVGTVGVTAAPIAVINQFNPLNGLEIAAILPCNSELDLRPVFALLATLNSSDILDPGRIRRAFVAKLRQLDAAVELMEQPH
jgi:hypothetical protein